MKLINKKFNLLFIEDSEEVYEFVIEELNKRCQKINIVHAKNKTEAIDILKNGSFFDLISLDLQIPINSELANMTPEVGLSLLSDFNEFACGTPIVISSGTSSVDMFSRILSQSNNVKIWSDNEYPTIQHFTKNKLNEYLLYIESMYTSVTSLFHIELDLNEETISIEHDRLLRIFTKQVNGLRVEVKKIGGGYSSSEVYLLTIHNVTGTTHQTIAKCGKHKEIEIDSTNYNNHINRLNPEVTPRKLSYIKYGAKNQSGVFYALAANFPLSYFESSLTNKNNKNIRKYIENITNNWQVCTNRKNVTIRDIRKKLISDEKANAIYSEFNLEWANEFENTNILINNGICHSDLHGENILINIENNSATLIDYGDVSENTITLDPITLECSFLFHPSVSFNEDWPTINHIKNWNNLDNYIDNSPIKDEIIFCRNWANKIKASQREIAATLYSYSLRQLKYSDTNKDIALELIKVAQNIIENS